MPFKYSYNNSDKIFFTRLEAGCGQGIFIVVGSVFIVIGIGLSLFSNDWEMPMLMFKILFPLFGFIAVYAGIKLPDVQRKTIPDQIIFDNLQGRVQINQKKSEVSTAFIYYNEIKDLNVKIKSHSSNSSGRSASRTYYTYHIYLNKKDGGHWELLRCQSENKALEELAYLNSIINWSAQPVKADVTFRSSSKYLVSDYGSRVELSWRNPVGGQPVFLVLFSIVFISVFYTIISSVMRHDGNEMGFFYFIGGFIFIVFLIVMIGNTLKLIKNSKTTYAVSVSDMSLDYIEKDLAGRIKKDIRFPVEDIHAISFSFDSENTERKIFIYTHEQFLEQQKLETSFTIASIKSLYNFYTNLVSLEMQQLTPVEGLYVENFLQEQLRSKARTDVA